MDGLVDRLRDRLWIGGCMGMVDGWMSHWMDGWMNGWVVGGIDARMAEVDELRDGYVFCKTFLQKPNLNFDKLFTFSSVYTVIHKLIVVCS